MDLEAADNLGQAGLYPPACFHCQQALEKALKALLLKQGKKFPKMHSLRELALQADKLPELGALVSDIDTDYANTRYVDVAGRPTKTLYSQAKFKERRAAAEKAFGLIEKWIQG
ncbi:HEPN domain-containing protein [Candidatus Micrarchaeota archaeon]|nr:HEPN domain-containing protein [Candidatus Micrarchaeota archaeon]